MTIEDETGLANLVIFEKLFETYCKEILQLRLIMVEGKLQVEGEVIHVIVQKCHNFSKLLRTLTPSDNENLPVLTLTYPNEKSIPPGINRKTQKRKAQQELYSLMQGILNRDRSLMFHKMISIYHQISDSQPAHY